MGGKKLAIFSTLATGLVETLINAFWSFDTEPQSYGGILPVEPPDAAGFYKHVFKIAGFTLADLKRPKIKRALNRSHRDSAPSGGRVRTRKRALVSGPSGSAPQSSLLESNCWLPAATSALRATTTRPRYEVPGHKEAFERRRALGLVFVADLRGAAASDREAALSRSNACCALTAGSRGFT